MPKAKSIDKLRRDKKEGRHWSNRKIKDNSQLPEGLCVKGTDARRYSSERYLGFIYPFVEHPVDTF